MASMWVFLFLIFATIFMVCPKSLASPITTQKLKLPTSTISAAPAMLPNPPLTSPPALSPDITPLLPSPGGSELSPSESPQPTIPSSRSPPNPDTTLAPGPSGGMVSSPPESLPDSSSVPLNRLSLGSVLLMGLLAFSG